MAEIGKTNAGDKSDITRTDHRDFHDTLQNDIAHRGFMPVPDAYVAASIIKHTRVANAGYNMPSRSRACQSVVHG